MDQVNAVIWIDLDDDLGSLKTDVTAVVQILFNLIDNVTMPANMFYQTIFRYQNVAVIFYIIKQPKLIIQVTKKDHGVDMLVI